MAAPSEGSRITSHIMPATTGGIMNGEMNSERTIPGKRLAWNSTSASQTPKTSWSISDSTNSAMVIHSPCQNS
ncbi:hypothetical protein [Bradyrhizobium sp. LM6.9]